MIFMGGRTAADMPARERNEAATLRASGDRAIEGREIS
jgi:hypothetical protein